MGRPKKSAVASRSNGALATNKGKVVNVKEELCGGYDTDGTYVVRKTLVRSKMAKGEVLRHEPGCEANVFTFCLYHSEFKTFNDGNESNSKPATYCKDGVNIAGWEAARKKAAAMKEECAALGVRAKVAKLRKCMKGADVRIRFEC